MLKKHEQAMEQASTKVRNMPMIEVLDDAIGEVDDTSPCFVRAVLGKA